MRQTLSILVVLCCFCLVSPVSADDELTKIRETLERVVQLMEAEQVDRQTQMILKRIELYERRLAPLRNDVKRLQEDEEQREAQAKELRRMIDYGEKEIDQATQAGETSEVDAMREQIDRFEWEIEQLAEQAANFRLRRMELENDLNIAERQIEKLDAILLERME